MKKMYTLSVIILMLLLITGCNNKNTENNSSERQKSDSSAEKEKGMENSSKKDIEDISGSFSEENRKILSVKQNFDGYFNFFGSETVMMSSEISEYIDGSHNIRQYYSKGSFKTKDAEASKETVFYSPNELFYKNMSTGMWEPVANPTEMQIKDRIDYKELAEVLTGILKNEKYELKETGNEYEVIITDKDFDFMRIFRKQFTLNLNGVSQEQLDKNIAFSFSKDSFLLDRLNITLKFKEPGKIIDININMKFSSWNSVNPEDFKVIPGK